MKAIETTIESLAATPATPAEPTPPVGSVPPVEFVTPVEFEPPVESAQPVESAPTATAADPLIQRLLRSANAIDAQQLLAVYDSVDDKTDVHAALVQSGLLGDDQLADLYCEHYLLQRFDPPGESFDSIDASVAALLPAQFCVRHRIVPLSDDGTTLQIAIDGPDGLLLADDIRFHTGRQMRAMFATPSIVNAGIVQLYGLQDFANDGPVRFESLSGQTGRGATTGSSMVATPSGLTPASRRAKVDSPGGGTPMDWLLARVVQLRADMVQLRSTDTETHLRFRIDGQFSEMSPPHDIESLIDQIDGVTEWDRTGPSRIDHATSCGPVQIRVHRCDVMGGRSWTLNFIRGPVTPPPIESLQFDPEDRMDFVRGVEKPRGLTIVAGPCDSGKSETLYAALALANDPSLSIFTVEQSVRYQLPGINQTIVDDTDHFGLHDHLQSVLCQSPDVLLVHQIRDSATADLCVRVAEGGRRVLVTLPSADCVSALRHLESFGVAATRIGQSVRAVVAQRRMRRLCDHCKVVHDIDRSSRHRLGIDRDAVIYKSVGCDRCVGRGYHGRITAYEVMRLNSRMSRKLSRYNTMQDLEDETSGTSLRDRMMQRVVAGETSLAELRATL